MSVDRAPIKRPSVDGIVGDNAGRVRGIEAGQTMPYCYGSYRYQWEANTVPDGWAFNTDTLLTIRLSPEIPIGGSGDYTTFDTTDDSILTNVAPAGGADDGGCIFVWSGGLFYWEANLQAEFTWMGETTLFQVTSFLTPPYQVAGKDNPRPSVGPIFGTSNYAPLDNLVQGGTFSTDGTFGGFVEGGSQGPVYGNQIVSTVSKCDAGDAGLVTLSIMCARWTPVGFAFWGGE